MTSKNFKQKRIIFDILAILVVFSLLICFAKPLFNFLSQKHEAAQYILNYRNLAPLIIIGLEIIQEFIIGLPGINTLSGYIFGPAWGTFYSIIGGTIGAIIAFYFARLLGRPIIEKFVHKEKLSKFDNFINGKKGIFVLFLMFFIPFLPDTLACYAAGLSPISISVFILITILGRFAPVFVAVLLGAQITTGYSTRLLIYVIVLGLFLSIFYLLRDKIEKYLLREKS